VRQVSFTLLMKKKEKEKNVTTTVIQFSTRGTVGSHTWSIQLIETSMLRSYHV
jgi:hypothetical protein